MSAPNAPPCLFLSHSGADIDAQVEMIGAQGEHDAEAIAKLHQEFNKRTACAALRKRIDPADPSETAYAIRCDLPVGRTETLLIVDQFEELLTENMTQWCGQPPLVMTVLQKRDDRVCRIFAPSLVILLICVRFCDFK